MVKFTGFSVYLNVKDVERSRKFYEGLGLKKVREFSEMSTYVLKAGDVNVVIGPANATWADAEAAFWLQNEPWGVGVLLMPTVRSVDEVYEKALAIGAEIDDPPQDQPWGSRTVGIVDPDGYVLMFDQELKPARPARTKKTTRRKAAAKKATPKKATRKAPAKRAAKKTTRKAAKKATRKAPAKKSTKRGARRGR